MAGVVDAFKEMIRVLVGLPADAGAPPDLMRLGFYPARVDVCQSDGKHCDVTPADTRVSKGEKNVEILTGIPGAVATVEPGAIVLLGWRRGDPASPVCIPAWVIGATVDKLTFNATLIELAGNTFSLLKTETLLSDISTLMGFLASWVPLVVTAVAAAPSGTAVDPGIAAQAQVISNAITAGTYKSTKVKNG